MLDGLNAKHASGDPGSYSSRFRSMHERRGNDAEESVHPVVRTHPVTGRRALFVNGLFTHSFEDMTPEESEPVLAYLYDHSILPEFTFRFRWSPGSVLIWDNRVVLHNALNDDFSAARNGTGFRRVLHRATLAGERPV